MAEADKGRPVPAGPAADGHGEPFLSRWSRLKQEGRDRPVEQPQTGRDAADSKSPPPELPPLDKLTFDSDFRSFLHPKVDEGVRRAALKKLFSDPRFNVMDGLDVYIDDYSKTEPIPAAMLAGLKQAQNILRWAKGEEDEPAKDQADEEKSLEVADAGQAALGPPEVHAEPGVDPAVSAPEPAPVSSDRSSATGSGPAPS